MIYRERDRIITCKWEYNGNDKVEKTLKRKV